MEIGYCELAGMIKLYHELFVEQSRLSSTGTDGPNGMSTEKQAANRLQSDLIPRYKNSIPEELRGQLEIDLIGLESLCDSIRAIRQ